MRTRSRKPKFLRAGVAILSAVLCAAVRADSGDSTIKLTVASSQPTTLAWIGAMHTLVVPELDRRLAARGSAYHIRWTESYGGALYKYGETLEGIQVGLADMGWVGTLWELSKLPLQNVTFYAPFASDDFRLVVDVVNELHRTVPAMNDAWTAQNVKFLGASALDTYHLMTTFPVDSVDDLRGRKILAPGPSAAWLEGTGAVAVDGSLTTYYQQIQTGVADGVITILTGAAPNRLHEVAPYITLVGLGSQVTGALAINLDTWNRLPDDARAELERLGREYSSAVADDIAKRYDASIARMRSDGAAVAEFPLAEKQKWLAAMPDIARPWIEATERRGQPAGAALRAYMSALRERGARPLRDWDRPH
ncbi:MAG TPA: C4-dicarboxylate TRAP transporter substrate-binding protein [Gammaproteobacteria bacterium]